MGKELYYIGCKIIKAVPMTKREFEEKVRGSVYTDENMHGYKVTYPDGYVSWSPESVFNTAYREITEAEKQLFL